MIGFIDWLLTLAFVGASWISYATLRHGPVLPPGTQDRPEPQPASPERPAAGTPAMPLDKTLAVIARQAGYPGLDSFLSGARRAYEDVVEAFAEGDLEDVGPLLGPAVREVFAGAIAGRRARTETMACTLIRLSAAEPVAAGIEAQSAWIDVRFVAEMVSATTSADGKLVEGHPHRVVEVAEIWTFERNLRSPDPNWRIVATDADA